jgi:hypothetical protein
VEWKIRGHYSNLEPKSRQVDLLSLHETGRQSHGGGLPPPRGKLLPDSLQEGEQTDWEDRGRGVLGRTGVGHLSNVSSDVVGAVSDSLNPAVGEVDGVGSGHSAGPVVGLLMLEVGIGVVVIDGVGVGVGGGLGQVGEDFSRLETSFCLVLR